MESVGLVWLIGGIGAAVVAKYKNKNGSLWLIYGLTLAPIALIHILQSPSQRKARIEKHEPHLGYEQTLDASKPDQPHQRSAAPKGFDMDSSNIDENTTIELFETERYKALHSLQEAIFEKMYAYKDEDSTEVQLPNIDIRTHILPLADDADLTESEMFGQFLNAGPLKIGDPEIDEWINSGDSELSPQFKYALTNTFLISATNACIAAKVLIWCIDNIQKMRDDIFDKANDENVPDDDIISIFDFQDHCTNTILNKSKEFGNFTHISDAEERDLRIWIHEAIHKVILGIGIGTPECPTIEQMFDIDDELDNGELDRTSSSKGAQFEQYCAELLEIHDYDVQISKGSGDQGGDILAEKDGIRYIIQCKDADKVGNKAVQEVLAALQYYEADYAAVATDGVYTASAKSLAAKNDIALLKSRNLEDLEVFFK